MASVLEGPVLRQRLPAMNPQLRFRLAQALALLALLPPSAPAFQAEGQPAPAAPEYNCALQPHINEKGTAGVSFTLYSVKPLQLQPEKVEKALAEVLPLQNVRRMNHPTANMV